MSARREWFPGVLTVRSPTSGRWCPARCRSILEAGSRQAVGV